MAASFCSDEMISQAVGPLRSATCVSRQQAEAHEAARGGRERIVAVRLATPAADAVEAIAVEAPHPVQAEMDAQPAGGGECEEHLLAVRLGADELAAVEPFGTLGEAALRTAGLDAVADELVRERVRETVDGVALGHSGGPR